MKEALWNGSKWKDERTQWHGGSNLKHIHGKKIKESSSFLSGGGTSMNEEGNAHL